MEFTSVQDNQKYTLTQEQESCVNYQGDKAPNLTVKGAAGSGKSIVIMQRAKKLLEQYSEEETNKIAIFTYNNTLATSTAQFLDVNEEKSDYITISTLDKYFSKIYMEMKDIKRLNIVRDDDEMKLIKSALDKHKKDCGEHRLHRITDAEDFWLDEIAWMKDMNISNQDKEIYLAMPRKGRGNQVRMGEKDRHVAFEIFCYYNVELGLANKITWQDINIFISHHVNEIPEHFKFEHVLVDEAQDMSFAKMIGAVALHKKSMVIAMDMNQRIYNQSWTLKQIGIVATTKKLTKSFRCTKQIDALAESLRRHNDKIMDADDISNHVIPEVEGAKPLLVKCSDEQAEKQMITAIIKKWLAENSQITIGVLASSKRQIGKFEKWLTSAGIYHEKIEKGSTFSMTTPGVKLATIYSAKGLEFVRVIIPQFEEGRLPRNIETTDAELYEEEMMKARNLAYVAMTRAKFSLLMTCSGKKSRFIGEMDQDLFEYQESSISEMKTSDVKVSTGNIEIQIGDALREYFESKGLEVIDKRANKGCLWVVGDEKSLEPYLKEVKTKFGVSGHFGKGKATKQRRGWFTQSKL